MLTIKLLGTPVFYLDDQALSPSITGRVAGLFIYLIITRQPQPRSTLANLFWTNVSEQEGKRNLRYLLRDLRKSVSDYVVVQGDNVAFNQTLPHWVDATTFVTYLNRPAAYPEDAAQTTILQELLNLYTGEFLAGFQINDAPNFEDWLQSQRRHLHGLATQGLQVRTQQHLAQGEYEEGLMLNQYLLTLEPWREEVHRQRMLLFAHAGQRSAALKQYELCCQCLAEELDAHPMEQTTTLYEQIKSGQWFMDPKTVEQPSKSSIAVTLFPQQSTPAIEKEPTPHQPPMAAPVAPSVDFGAMPYPTHFYGREAELATLDRWIGQEHCRLVALLGMSGQGKTALATTFVQKIVTDEARLTHGFTQVIWRSLQGAPSCTEILCSWLQQLDEKPIVQPNLNFDHLVAKLFARLQQERCLLVLDDIDAVTNLPNGQNEYSRLFRLFFQRRHQSCLLLTGRSRLPIFTHIDERKGALHCMELEGLSVVECAELCAAYEIDGDQDFHHRLHHQYAGNPLLLNQAADLIYTLFDSNGNKFLQEGFFFLGDIGTALAMQLTRISPLEQEIIQTLAAHGEPLCPEELWQMLTSLPTKQHYFHALQTLQRSFMIYQEGARICLPNLLFTYLSNQNHETDEYTSFCLSYPTAQLTPVAMGG